MKLNLENLCLLSLCIIMSGVNPTKANYFRKRDKTKEWL
ncbi:hypothetical protein CCP2SC5_160009 [Azospirillaceae bacterium]